jgi:hypothetical protein
MGKRNKDDEVVGLGDRNTGERQDRFPADEAFIDGFVETLAMDENQA